MPRPHSVSHDILQAALAGLRSPETEDRESDRAGHAIVHGIGVGLKTIVEGAAPIAKRGAGSKAKRRSMSAEGRKRIAAAQKKRWAAVRKAAKKSKSR